jgi:hypothetical protein
VFDDELAHGTVVIAQHTEDLLRLGRLSEGGEAAQIAEGDGDLAAMAFAPCSLVISAATCGDRKRESSPR